MTAPSSPPPKKKKHSPSSSPRAWWRYIPRPGLLAHLATFLVFVAMTSSESRITSSGYRLGILTYGFWLAILALHFFLPGIKYQLGIGDEWQPQDTGLERVRDIIGGLLAGFISFTLVQGAIWLPNAVLLVVYLAFAFAVHLWQTRTDDNTSDAQADDTSLQTALRHLRDDNPALADYVDDVIDQSRTRHAQR